MVMELTANHSALIRSSARYEYKYERSITSAITFCHHCSSVNAISKSGITTYAVVSIL